MDKESLIVVSYEQSVLVGTVCLFASIYSISRADAALFPNYKEHLPSQKNKLKIMPPNIQGERGNIVCTMAKGMHASVSYESKKKTNRIRE